MRRPVVLGIALILAVATPAGALTVSAAASLRGAVSRVARAFEADAGVRVHCNFAGSGLLRRQIEESAPVDVFVSAGWSEIERLRAKGLVAGTPVVVARNRLVVIVPEGSPWRGGPARDLLTAAAVRRIATGDPEGVPFGHYARAALTEAGLWQRLAGRTVYAADVRQALEYAERGAVDAAIVYATDARRARRAVLVGEVPGSRALRIETVAARVGRRTDPAAPRFLAYLTSHAAQRIFRDDGFLPPRP